MGKYIDRKDIIDVDDKYATVTAAVATGATTPTRTTVLTLQSKPGKSSYLYFLGNAIQAGGEAYVTFRLLINGASYYPYDGTLNQWADPSSNIELPIQYEIPVGSKVEIVADNSDTGNTYSATARIRIAYVDFQNNSSL